MKFRVVAQIASSFVFDARITVSLVVVVSLISVSGVIRRLVGGSVAVPRVVVVLSKRLVVLSHLCNFI